MAEWSKALRSGRSPLLWAWVRIPLLTKYFFQHFRLLQKAKRCGAILFGVLVMVAEWRSGSVLGP